uniref:Uncharacterized protein n=1 Tax=Proboscia inermis TaxID=420281 RepID=A0A7S0CNH6_9STRA|mmetsp:Transcript_44455/g.52059  ORF Transcript_44455/g.52059 Transcript_44455/m.52059 type:complete len:254 (-) Transcript_44455:393-1154(-)
MLVLSRSLTPARIVTNRLLLTTNLYSKRSTRVFHATGLTSKNAVGKTSSLASFPKDNPFAFQLIIATCKTSAADILVQMVVEKKKLSEIDWKRNGIFVVFGFAYLGCFQWFIMVTKYRQWFPTMDRFAKLSFAEKIKDTAGILDAMKMVVFDVCVHLPMMYFPAYYTCKEFVTGTTYNPLDWVKDGCTKYYNNSADDLLAMVKLWGPSDCIQFVLPLHIRMPFRHLVSFFWTMYVSFTRGGAEPEEELKIEQA